MRPEEKLIESEGPFSGWFGDEPCADVGDAGTERIQFDIEEKGQDQIIGRSVHPLPVLFMMMLVPLAIRFYGLHGGLFTVAVMAAVGGIIRHSRQVKGTEAPVCQATYREMDSARLVARGRSVVLSRLAQIRDEPFEPVLIEYGSSVCRPGRND